MVKRKLNKVIIVVLLIINWSAVISVIFGRYSFQKRNSDVSNLIIDALSIVFIFSITCLRGILKCKKWADYGYWITFIISLILCIFYRKLISYAIITFLGALFITIPINGNYEKI